MDRIKTLLILIAIIVGAWAVLAAIGLIYSLLAYLVIFGILGLAGYIGLRVLTSKSQRELESPAPERQLHKVERTLEEYKRKLK